VTTLNKYDNDVSPIISHNVRRSTRSFALNFLFNNFVWLLILMVLVVAAFTTPSFFRPTNMMNLLVQSVMLAMLVLAESICLITGYFDMSIEGTLIFTSVFAAWLMAAHPAASGLEVNPFLGIILMLLAGAAIGAINGFLIAYVKMNAFITTLAMTIVLIGSCVTISRGNTLGPFPDNFAFFGAGNVGPIPVPILLLVFIYGLFGFVLTRTPFGRKLFAVGGNRNAAQASGINTKQIVFIAYVLSGLIAAIGGLVLSGRMGSAVAHMTTNNLLYAFAAAVIGGVSPFGGQGRIMSIFGGVILLMIINKLLVTAQVNPFLITTASGLIIFIAMLLLTIKQNLVLED
jgi:simple sugar transport system permease protein